MKKKLLSIVLALVLILGLCTGCGASSKAQSMDYAVIEEAMEVETPAAVNGSASLTSSGTGGSTALPEGRKWVITVTMSAETDDLDTMTAQLDQHINALGGYVEDQRIYNGSSYSNRRYRYANLTIRIPAEDVDKFTQEVSGIANVVSKETSREDITLTYVSTESRLTALETEQARLLELLEKAETMADLLEIEARLTDVRYELENYGSRLRLYDNQVDYATIHLDIEEVQEYTPVAEPTFLERIIGGFADSLEGLGDSLENLVVLIVSASPFLLVYGGIVLVIVLVVRKVRKIGRVKREKKAKKNEEEQK